MKIAAYIRVSSVGQNAAGQKAEIRRWLNGHDIAAKEVRWFEDKTSGKTLARPAFEELQQAIFMGEIKTVVVWRLDRLARNQRDGLNLICDWCEQGIRLVSVTQATDISGAQGRFFASILMGIAEMELEAIKERQAAGIAAAKERGVYEGNGRPKGSTKANPAKAIKLREQGNNVTEIAKIIGVDRKTVSRYLKMT